MIHPLPVVEVDSAPWRLSGAVYGTLLNHRPALAALGDAVNAAPYKAAPVAPVLYQKPRNTLAGDGAQVVVPAGEAELELGAALGIVIGRTACPILAAAESDREGYVPNVVYTCGAMRVGDELFIPYGISDSAIGFATTGIGELLNLMA